MKSKRDREEACLICSHYHDLDGGEPCSICGHVMAPAERTQQEALMPTAIIPGLLYLANYDQASRPEVLKTMGISHILNTVVTCPTLYKNTFTYHTVSSTPPEFKECFEFLETCLKDQNKVLVYCMSGQSRSPTVVIGFLMKYRGWRLAESYKWVKERRQGVRINQADTERLQALERDLHSGACSVPLGFEALSAASAGFSGACVSQACGPHQASTVCPNFGFPSGASSSQPAWSLSGSTTAAPLAFTFGAAAAAAAAGGAPPAAPTFAGPPQFVFGGLPPATTTTTAGNGAATSDMEH